MAKVKYTYNISDTLNNKVDHSALQDQVYNSAGLGFGELKVMLDHINIDFAAAKIDIWMRNGLDGYDRAVLDSVVQSHDGEPSDGVYGIEINTLKEEDGRQIVTPSPIGVGWNIWFTGADDDQQQFAIYQQNPFAPSGRGDGKPFKVSVLGSDPDPTVEEFSFSEPIHIHDGEINWGPDGYWNEDDHFSVGIRFSPTTYTITPGMGNANLYPVVPGTEYCLIVPAAGDGYVTVDLSKACPIRETNWTGYWNVTESTGEISPGQPGSSRYNLYTFPLPDAWFIKRIATANMRHIMEPDVYRTEAIHPNWKIIISVTKVTPTRGWLTGWFCCFRKNIT